MVVATSWGIGGNEVSWVREGPRRRLRKGLSGERNGRSGPRQREASFRRMEEEDMRSEMAGRMGRKVWIRGERPVILAM